VFPEKIALYHASVPPCGSSGYVMIKSIHINDFKCFRNLKLEDLPRINVLVGESGSGKTAFLEAIFLAAGASQELYFRTRTWRGFPESFELTNSGELYDEIARDIFHVADDETRVRAAYLRFSDDESGPRVLKILQRAGSELLLNTDNPDRVARPILFQWKAGGRTFESTVQPTKDGLRVKARGRSYQATFLSAASLYQSQNVRRFSALSRRSAHRPIVAAIHKVFPSIHDLSIEMNMGQTMLFASVHGMPEKVPLPAISSGLSKFVSIALAIVAQPHGAVLVDEIENAFYYQSLKPLLSSLYELAAEHRVQIFATTHSYEFLEATASVMADRADDFALLRMSKGEHESDISMVVGRPAIAAIEQTFEVR
jgi:ABC-type lipoprotein export system ATPase subunit